MINLADDATFRAPVSIPVLGRDAPIEVEFEFRALGRKRIASLLMLMDWAGKGRLRRWLAYLGQCWRVKRIATMADVLDEFVCGWGGIEPAYSRRALGALLTEYPGAWLAIFESFLRNWREERLKN